MTIKKMIVREPDKVTQVDCVAMPIIASEFSEVKLVARDTEIFDDVGNNAARNIARMPRESDDAFGAEGIGVMPVTSGIAQVHTADFTETTLQLTAVEGGVFAHGSGREHKLVAEGGRDRPARFQKRLQVSFGRLLKMKNRLTPISAVRVATGQQSGLGDPHAAVTSQLDFRDRYYHRLKTIPVFARLVNAATSRSGFSRRLEWRKSPTTG